MGHIMGAQTKAEVIEELQLESDQHYEELRRAIQNNAQVGGEDLGRDYKEDNTNLAEGRPAGALLAKSTINCSTLYI